MAAEPRSTSTRSRSRTAACVVSSASASSVAARHDHLVLRRGRPAHAPRGAGRRPASPTLEAARRPARAPRSWACAQRLEILRPQAALQRRVATSGRADTPAPPRRARARVCRLPPVGRRRLLRLRGRSVRRRARHRVPLGMVRRPRRLSPLWAHDDAAGGARRCEPIHRTGSRTAAAPSGPARVPLRGARGVEAQVARPAARRRGGDIDRWLRAGVLVDLYAVVRQAMQVGEESYSLKRLERHYGFDRRGAHRPRRRRLDRGLRVLAPDGRRRVLDAIRHYNREDCLRPRRSARWLLDDDAPRRPPPSWRRLRRSSPSRRRRIGASRVHGRACGRVLEGCWRGSRRRRRRGSTPISRAAAARAPAALPLPRVQAAVLALVRDAGHDRRARCRRARGARGARARTRRRSRSPAEAVYCAGPTAFPPQETKLERRLRCRAVHRKSWNVVESPTTPGHQARQDEPAPRRSARSSRQRRPTAARCARRRSARSAAGVARRRGRFARRARASAPASAPRLDLAARADRDVDQLVAATLALERLVPRRSRARPARARPTAARAWWSPRCGPASASRSPPTATPRSRTSCAPSRTAQEEGGYRLARRVQGRGLRVAPRPRRAVDEDPDDVRRLRSSSRAPHGCWPARSTASAFDLLFIDEAGQFSLANAAAVGDCAPTSVVLLGDPQQLPQVNQADHPDGAGASVLEHLLDGETTIAARPRRLPRPTGACTRRLRVRLRARYEGRLAHATPCARPARRRAGPLVPAPACGRSPSTHEGAARRRPRRPRRSRGLPARCSAAAR